MRRGRKPVPPVERFWRLVDRNGPITTDPLATVTTQCWLFTGTTARGYGSFWDGKAKIGAHRFAYELEYGPIPEGLVIDHLCRVPSCVRPSHLEAVTQAENIGRGVGKAAPAMRTGMCSRGHDDWIPNTNGRGRRCRPCALQGSRRRRARLSARERWQRVVDAVDAVFEESIAVERSR